MSQQRRIAPIDLLHAAGLSATLFAAGFGPLIFTHKTRVHSAEPLTAVAFANIFDIILVAVVIAVLLALLRMTRSWPACRFCLVVAIPVILLRRNTEFFPWTVRSRQILLFGIVWLILCLLLRFFSAAWYAKALEAGRIVLTGFEIFALLALVQLLRSAAWHPGPKEIHASLSSTQAFSIAIHPRLVWIVLDELSYDQAFEHRASDVSLPNFDALRSESTLYTHVQPAGFKTEKILPSLLIGSTVIDLDYTASNQLKVRTSDHSGWQLFDAGQSLFAEARHGGWHTSVVGWFVPYCPTFQQWIDSCYWEGWGLSSGPMSTYVGFRPNVAIFLKVFAEKLLARRKSTQDDVSCQVQQRLTSYQELEAHSLAALKSPDTDFVFLHLPLPHPPGIYDRHTGRFVQTAGQSYLDNLVLADRVLGDMVAILRASRQLPNTTLIVNGDHGWRTTIWREDGSWTDEDERASRGGFDSRPALLIHKAGQSTAETVAAPVPLLSLHGMVSTMLRAAAPVSGGTSISVPR